MGVNETAEWVDGKAFAAWLEGRRPDLYQAITESQQRTLYRLRTENGCGSLDVADRFCCALNLHINEIPEWVWSDPPNRQRKEHPPEIRDRACRMLASGSSVRDVSEVMGIPFQTVATWRKRVVNG